MSTSIPDFSPTLPGTELFSQEKLKTGHPFGSTSPVPARLMASEPGLTTQIASEVADSVTLERTRLSGLKKAIDRDLARRLGITSTEGNFLALYSNESPEDPAVLRREVSRAMCTWDTRERFNMLSAYCGNGVSMRDILQIFGADDLIAIDTLGDARALGVEPADIIKNMSNGMNLVAPNGKATTLLEHLATLDSRVDINFISQAETGNITFQEYLAGILSDKLFPARGLFSRMAFRYPEAVLANAEALVVRGIDPDVLVACLQTPYVIANTELLLSLGATQAGIDSKLAVNGYSVPRSVSKLVIRQSLV